MDGAGSVYGSRLFRDSHGQLWVGTLGQGLWRVRGHEHLEPALGNPSTCEGPQEVGFATVVRAAPGRGHKRASPAPAAHCEAQSAQDAAGLVGVEVGAIKAGHHADHLLGREPLAGYDDVVLPQRLRHDVAKPSPDLRGVEGELLLCDRGLYLTHTYWIALTGCSHKWRSRRWPA